MSLFKRTNYAFWNRPGQQNSILYGVSDVGPIPIRTYNYSKDSVNTAGYWSYLHQKLKLPENHYSLYVDNHWSPLCYITNKHWVLVYDTVSPFAVIGMYVDSDSQLKYTAPQQIGYPSHWNVGINYDDSIMADRRVRILAKLSANKASLGEFIGEFRQCRDLFLNTARRVLRCVIMIRSFNIAGAARALAWDIPQHQLTHISTLAATAKKHRVSGSKFLANVWLEFHYGWQPLLSDLFGVCETLADGIDSENLLKRVSTRSSKIYSVRESSSSTSSPNAFIQNSYSKCQVKYGIVIHFKVVNENKHLSEVLGLNNPLQIAWNLLPWGYVVDWFVNVNSFLSQTMATSGLEFHSGVEVFNANNATTHRRTMYDGSNDIVGYGAFQTGMYQHRHNERQVRRVVITSFPTPNIHFGSLIHDSRIPTALALMRQRFR